MAMSNIPTPQKTFPFVNIFPHDLFRMQGSQIFVHSLSSMFAFCMSGGSHSQDTRDQTLSDLWGLPQKGAFYFIYFFGGGGLDGSKLKKTEWQAKKQTQRQTLSVCCWVGVGGLALISSHNHWRHWRDWYWPMARWHRPVISATRGAKYSGPSCGPCQVIFVWTV